MTRDAQKRKEEKYVGLMLKLLPLALSCEPVERESPDFLLQLEDGTTVGLEIVEAREASVVAGFAAIKRMKSDLSGALRTAGLRVLVNFSVTEGCGTLLNDNR